MKNIINLLFFIIILMMFALSLTAASAQDKKQQEEPAKGEKKKEKEDENKANDPVTLEAWEYFEAPDYKKLTAEFFQKMSQEITLLENIYKKTPPGERRADIYFRLADVYWLKAKYENLREMEIYNREYDKFMREKRKTKPKLPKFRGRRSLRMYDRLINNYPKYSRLDEVLFLAGYHSGEIQFPNYYKYYEKLIKLFPRSRFNIDARMALGEYYFRHRRLADAIDIYETVLAYGPTKVYNYALYKLGWCYYNKGSIKKAINLLKTVVERSSRLESKHAIELRDEALKNLVLFYSDLGQIDEAIAYFESVGKRELSRKVLESLADVYFEQSKYKSSIRTFKRLIEFDRLAPDVPLYYSKVIRSYQKSGRDGIARKHMERYISRFEKGTDWYRHNKKEDRQDAMDRAEQYLRFLAKSTHEAAQKEPDEARKKLLYVKATDFYKLYLSKFPKHKNAYDMKFFLAEIYFQLEDYASASKYYAECINDPENKGHLKEAVTSNIQAITFLEKKEYEEIIDKINKASVASGQKEKSYEKIPFGTWAPKLIEACNKFIELFPKDEKIAETIYQKARLNYNYNNFEEAMPDLLQVFQNYPKTEVADFARRMVLDIYGIRKDWDNILNWAEIFLKDKHFATPENKTYLYNLIQDATFKKALALANEGENKKAAEIFVGLQRRYPKSKFGDKALHNAIINYLIINDFSNAIANFRKLASVYPSSKHVGAANLAIARNYESRLNYKKAAQFYEIFVKREPRSYKTVEVERPDGSKAKRRINVSANSLFNAALYRETMGQYAQAIANYKKYIALYPKRKDVPDMYYTIALIYEKAKNYKMAAESFKRYYTRFRADFDKNVVARYKYIKATEKFSKGDKSRDYRRLIHYYNANKSAYERQKKDDAPSLAARYAAKSELVLLQPLYRKFEGIKFTMPAKVLKSQIDTKAKLLKQLQDRYLNVVKLYGDSETGIEALYQIGLIYQKFGEELFHAPVPKGLTPEAMDLYQQEMEKQAKPLEKKAINAFEECLKKAFELNVYNKYTKLAYQKLQQFKPDQYKLLSVRAIHRTYKADPVKNFTYYKKVELK